MSEPEHAASSAEDTPESPDTTEAETDSPQLSDDEKLANLSKLTGKDPIKKPPKLSFRASAAIAPTSSAVDLFEGYEAVTYIFDDDENTLWIVPLNEYDEDDSSKKSISNDPQDGFNARALYERLDLNYEKARRFTCEWVDEHEAVKVDMDQTPEKHG
ncbi:MULTISPECIES: hypothetical protein [Haloferacaceae]|uniref:Uncharacterized protein n=2 Tax=Haloferacaceae TaxID=1644056 RepID=A0ABD6DBR5_9EURY|nr:MULTISPECIES: hypothetical protein [Halorubraceae]CDK38182.1 hypothetical protein BN903_382 [Halorubrum sp. AJ67]